MGRRLAGEGPFGPPPISLLPKDYPIAVGVSGGGDSLGLVFWLRDWGYGVVGLVVDHGLRAEAGAEAARTVNLLRENDIEAYLLCWEGDKPERRLQEAARKARYRLLEGWCISNGVRCLALAHHLEDQAETFLIRQGSGTVGLSCMQEWSYRPFGWLWRPLLGAKPEVLRNYLRAKNIEWIEDPSNQNEKFERVHWRNFLKENVGLSAKLAQEAGNFSLERETIEKDIASLLAKTLTIYPLGYARLDGLTLWRETKPEIAQIALGRIIGALQRRDYAPDFRSLAQACKSLSAKSFSLGGFLFISKREHILIVREDRNLPIKPLSQTRIIWDKRWEVTIPTPNSQLYIGKLGNFQADIPLAIRQTLPGIYDERGLLAIPPLGFYRESKAEEIQTKFLPGTALDAGFCLFPRYNKLSIE